MPTVAMRAVFCSLLMQLVNTSTLDAAYTFTPLGYLDGVIFYSTAMGVSNDGAAIVGYSSATSGYEAFRWTSSDGMIGLGDLPGGNYESIATGISGDGSVIVGYSAITFDFDGYEAFRWTSSEGMVGLGDLPGGGFISRASGISNDGLVIVGNGTSTAGNEAFRWTSSDGMIGLGDLPGGPFGSRALGVSSDGSTVVGIGSSNVPFYWTVASGMLPIQNMIGQRVDAANARGVSGDGTVVVGSANAVSFVEAFRWTSSEGMIGLGDLPGGIDLLSFYSQAFGISGNGSIVVGRSISNLGSEAYFWTEQTGMVSLKDYLVARGVDLEGWKLEVANAISFDGSTIVGHGVNPQGFDEAWRATIPEASSVVLIGFAAIALVVPVHLNVFKRSRS